VDVIAMKRLIKDDNGNVGDAAEVDKVFDWKRPPNP
jgi:hypothetical protein